MSINPNHPPDTREQGGCLGIVAAFILIILSISIMTPATAHIPTPPIAKADKQALDAQIPRPFPTYPGGKDSSGVYQEIINRIPAHTYYFEPFLGGGAIFRHKRLADYSYVSDLDQTVVTAWRRAMPAGNPAKEMHYLNGQQVNIFGLHWKDLLREPKCDFSERVFIYIDPPYPFSARKGGSRIYNHEMSDSDHIDLLRKITENKSRRAKIMISSYQNDLYDSYLVGWHKHNFTDSSRKGKTIQTIWMNYDIEALPLHDYRYLGDDRRKRQDNKAKTRRWVEGLRSMDRRQREAILQAIKKEFSL